MAKYKKYEKYRYSGVKWLGDIPNDWEIVDFRRCTSLSQGLQIPQEERFYEEGKNRYLYLTIKYLNSEKTDIDKEFVENPNKNVICEKDDVLLARTGATGVVITDVEGVYHNNFFKIKYDKNKLLKKYLVYYLSQSGIQEHFKLVAGTTTIPDLNHGEFLSTKVMIPPMNVQNQIVKFLVQKTSEIDSLIADKEKIVTLLEEKRQAIITEAVTKGLNPNVDMKDSGVEWIGDVPEHWEVVSIKRLSRVMRGASPRPIDDPKYFDEKGKYSWVRISDVSKCNKYLEITEQKLSDIGASLSVKMKPEDIFLSICATVGKPCITKIYCCIHDGFVYFPDFKENKQYLYYIFEAGEAYKGLGKLGTQLNLNSDTVGSIKIPLPSRVEQEEIVSFLKDKTVEYDGLVLKIEQQIEKLKEYRQSLISEAVTGKIDVRNYFEEA